MRVNPYKFQKMILSCEKRENKYILRTNYSHITSKDFVTVLDVEMDNKLSVFQLFVEKQVNN